MMLPPNADHASLIIERGRSAAQLLEDDCFKSVVDDLTSYNLSALVAARPGDSGREAREYHHLMQYALTEICAELTSRRAAGAQMEEALHDQEDFV